MCSKIDCGVFIFISTPVMQIYYLRLSMRHRFAPPPIHTAANGPFRVLLVLLSTEIKARFIIKCQLVHDMNDVFMLIRLLIG